MKKKPSFSLTALKNAAATLYEILDEPESKIVRDASIQRFEYTFEIAWKTLKRYFKINNQLDESNTKNILREAGKQGLIDSVEDWFAYQEARNLTSHTYHEPNAEQVYELVRPFARDLKVLIERLESLVEARR